MTNTQDTLEIGDFVRNKSTRITQWMAKTPLTLAVLLLIGYAEVIKYGRLWKSPIIVVVVSFVFLSYTYLFSNC